MASAGGLRSNSRSASASSLAEKCCAQPRPTLCTSPGCSPPGASVHGIAQARILERVAIPSPGDLPDPRIETVSLVSPVLGGRFFITVLHGCFHIPHYYIKGQLEMQLLN